MPNEIYHRSNFGNPNAEGFGDVYYDHAATNKLYNHSDYYENSDGTDATLKDLNNKASIVLTPTAYSDGSLNTVIPPYAPSEEADFDFSRGSSATRVNEQGLVENSQGNDFARIDFTDGTGSLLIEPQRTNLISYSEDFSSLDIRNNAVVTSDAILSPSGLLNADEITFDGTSSGRVQEAITVTDNQSYTISLYLKNKNLSDTTQVWIGFSGSTQGSYVTITNEWQRYDITTTSDNTTEYPRIQFNGTGSLYAWGFQVEQGDFATSYIPTSGSTVTRSADVANNSGNADLFNDSEGVLYSEIAALYNSRTNRTISITNGTGAEKVQIMYFTASTTVRMLCVSDGSTFNQAHTLTDITDFVKVAFKYKSGDHSFWVNGVKVTTKTNAFTPIGLNELAFDNGSGGARFFGKVKAVAVFKEALTDAELQELTS